MAARRRAPRCISTARPRSAAGPQDGARHRGGPASQEIAVRARSDDQACLTPSTTAVGLLAQPAIEHAAERAADERRDPEHPELRQRPAADEQRRAGAARRVHRGVGDRDADEVDEGQAEADGDAARSPSAPRPSVAPMMTNRNTRSSPPRRRSDAIRVAAGRVLAVAVGGEAAGGVEARPCRWR